MTRSFLNAAWGTLAAALVATPAARAAESPRMVITPLHVESPVGSRERALLRVMPLVDVLRHTLTNTHSFRVQVRDDAAVRELIRELQVQQSPLAREGREKRFGLDTPDYILIPTLKSLRTRTEYTKADLIAGMYERRDSGELELHVQVLDLGGTVVFERSAREIINFGRPREATEEQKRANAPPPVGPVRAAAEKASQRLVNALIARTNPITVLRVRGDVLVIDRGAGSGFDQNTVFTVLSPPEEEEHPTTGRKYRISATDFGEARVVRIGDDTAELRLVNGDATKVPKGSVVRIEEKNP
jgi:hypothetical protein